MDSMQKLALVRRTFLILMVAAPLIGGTISIKRVRETQQNRAAKGYETGLVDAYAIDDRLEEGTATTHSLEELTRATRPGMNGLGLGVVGFVGWVIFSIKTRQAKRALNDIP